MARPVTLFTGQWADLPLETLAEKAHEWGYDGLELACSGDHFDVEKALSDPGYCQSRHDILAKYDRKVWAISNHLVGPGGAGYPQRADPSNRAGARVGRRQAGGSARARAEEMKNTARAAKALGVNVVNGFTGSSIWHLLYSFPPVHRRRLRMAFKRLAARWNPILDVFRECGVKFALEVHPTEIAYDIYTAQRALQVLDNRPEFGFNFDPSHLHWQFVDPGGVCPRLPPTASTMST